MPYMLLIVEKAGDRTVRSEAQGRELYERMLLFSADLKSRGVLTMSQSLKTDAAGVRVTKQTGSLTLHDGPFAEAREMIGGFFLLTCETREEALRIAEECPAAEWATVEVRELGPCYR
jgi:hypothetical protein